MSVLAQTAPHRRQKAGCSLVRRLRPASILWLLIQLWVALLMNLEVPGNDLDPHDFICSCCLLPFHSYTLSMPGFSSLLCLFESCAAPENLHVIVRFVCRFLCKLVCVSSSTHGGECVLKSVLPKPKAAEQEGGGGGGGYDKVCVHVVN